MDHHHPDLQNDKDDKDDEDGVDGVDGVDHDYGHLSLEDGPALRQEWVALGDHTHNASFHQGQLRTEDGDWDGLNQTSSENFGSRSRSGSRVKVKEQQSEA